MHAWTAGIATTTKKITALIKLFTLMVMPRIRDGLPILVVTFNNKPSVDTLDPSAFTRE